MHDSLPQVNGRDGCVPDGVGERIPKGRTHEWPIPVIRHRLGRLLDIIGQFILKPGRHDCDLRDH